ncbi:MAG: hypothetical protein HGA16_02915, partial [Candidatus Moranbacteria bacterium]|nr:hypothetical protein [Candidatus Moranbacteria bacterium]
KGEPIRSPNIPASFHVLVNELKGLCLNVELKGAKTIDEDGEGTEPAEERNFGDL